MNYNKLTNFLKSKNYEILTDNTQKNKLDCFFYDELVLKYKKGKYIYTIIAVGDIEIFDKNKNWIYANHRNVDDKLNAKNDKDLWDIINQKRYEVNHNNWFEFTIYDIENKCWVCDGSLLEFEVFYSLSDFLNNEDYNKKIIKEYEKEV